jgi:hypothetical protein
MAQTINADNGVISGSTGLKFTADTTGILALQTASTTRVTVDASGNVGIGVTPSASETSGGSLYFSSALISSAASGAATIAYNSTGNSKYVATGFASQYYQLSGTHVWRTASSGTAGAAITFTQAMTLDASGNLGIGVTPSAWVSAFKATQVGNRAAFYASATNAGVGNNHYYNGTNFIYIATAAASTYEQSAGVHSWYNAPSGTADNTITFTQAMTLDASGNLGIGSTSSFDISPTGTGQYPQLATWSTSNTISQAWGYYGGANTSAANLVFIKSRSSTIGTNTAVVSGDQTGTIIFRGADGTNYKNVANIQTAVDGTVSAGIVPGRLTISTTNTGGTLTERMRIDSAGNVGIGTISPSSYGLLTVLSTTAGSAKINITDNSAGAAAPLLQFGVNSSNGFNTSDAARVWTTASASNIASLNFSAYNTAAPSTAQMVLNAGNLGVGVSPSYKLHVYGAGSTASNPSTSANTGATIAIQDSGALSGNGGMIQFGASQGYFAGIKGYITDGATNSTGDLIFATRTSTADATLTERMRINAVGSSVFSGLIYHTAATAVTAAGTTQGTATALTTEINHVTNVGASTGVRLPTPASAGLRIFIRNGGVDTLNVYPHSTGNIAGTGVNAAISLDLGTTLEFIAFDTTNWYIPSAVLS